MFISSIKLKNWRNYLDAQADFGPVSYVIGANASGKSNLLDAFRFLRDIATPEGGGLQQAVKLRGGKPKLCCLHARGDTEVRLEVHWSGLPGGPSEWSYILGFNAASTGKDRRPFITQEKIVEYVDGKPIATHSRPNKHDKVDRELLTETHLEQKATNRDFRVLVDEFASVTYLHLVPQLLKFGGELGSRQMEGDPFGQSFLERIAEVSDATRRSRLERIKKALRVAAPQFVDLKFERDIVNGRPHLWVKYNHHRPKAGWQREDQMSDGTLRMIALFWLLQENKGLLLLEEPELSLDEDVVRALPSLIEGMTPPGRRQRQIVLTTHSSALQENPGIDGRYVVRVEAAHEGSRLVMPSEEDNRMMKLDGFPPAQVLLPKVHPVGAADLAL